MENFGYSVQTMLIFIVVKKCGFVFTIITGTSWKTKMNDYFGPHFDEISVKRSKKVILIIIDII